MSSVATPRNLGLSLRLPVVLLACYWPAFLFIFHVPLEPQPPGPDLPVDKLIHIVAYGGLAFLLAWWWHPARRGSTMNMTQRLTLFCLVLLHGIVDEVTQPLTGRSLELGDLAGDALGAVCGLAVYQLATRVPLVKRLLAA